MRIFRYIGIALALMGAALISHSVTGGAFIAVAEAEEYAKPKRAFEKGIRDYRAGNLSKAIDALEYATKRGHFRAKFYLARIYASNAHPYTNHGRSFQIYQEIVDQYAEEDPAISLRSAYVARAIVQLARFLKNGIPSIDMDADPGRAAAYLDHAAKYFGDREAQYELAKMYLAGDGVAENAARGKHWLSSLARSGHAEAQAYLGDLFWRGKYVEPNKVKGMAYVMLSLENAAPHNRVWIEELYQNIFCTSSPEIRRDAVLVAANLRASQTRKRAVGLSAFNGLGSDDFQTTRTCRNGEQVAMPKIPTAGSKPIVTPPSTDAGSSYYGTAGGFGLRNVGAGESGR